MAAVRGAECSNEVKISAKKLKKELRLYMKIPVWICEYHQEVLPYIYRAIASKHLPFTGITLLHFDSHPDLMAPLEMKAEKVYDKDLLFDVVSIADWILPAVYVGHIRKVIWIKPPWSEQISDKTLLFNVGRHKVEGTLRVSSCEKYFCEDGLYASREELENCQELTVVVKTMPVNTSHFKLPNNECDMNTLNPNEEKKLNNDSQISCSKELSCKDECKHLKIAHEHVCLDTKNTGAALKLCLESNSELLSDNTNVLPKREGENLKEETVTGFQDSHEGNLHSEGFQTNTSRSLAPDSTTRLQAKNERPNISCTNKNCERGHESGGSQLFVNKVLSHLEEPYILDIDMDFFSTLNPFETMFSKEEFEELKGFYNFPPVDSDMECDMIDASRIHKKNVQRLERTLNFLKENDLETSDTEAQPSFIDLEFLKFIKRWKDLRNKPVDYDMVHSAGMTTNLPVHITDKGDIVKMMKNLEHFLSSVPKPTIITLARSSDDDYTPPSAVDFIQSCLVTCLENCYRENIEFFHKYKDE